MNSRRKNAAKLKRKRVPAASDTFNFIKKLFGGRLFTYKVRLFSSSPLLPLLLFSLTQPMPFFSSSPLLTLFLFSLAKIGKKDKAGTVLTFEQTGGLDYTITEADIKNRKSIDGALKLNKKWRSAATKAKLQVRTTSLFSCLFCTRSLVLCPFARCLPTRTSRSTVAARWASSRSRASPTTSRRRATTAKTTTQTTTSSSSWTARPCRTATRSSRS